ncbi:hypothetical protein [Saccharothrix variisporea]|uniref:Uncharacterized protein n=1 Tax=Saccharothrix variisporea TaxID=543527 RepID=A0A495X6I5_9PSEU|nr:hypothetical protein [Saccharothrix variisporea]RKT67108.1 hypothetical protein DFJ66_0276 [Saccharothrix variisporea]
MANLTGLLAAPGPFAVLPSAARTASPDTYEFDASRARANGLHLIIDVTAITATPSVTVTVQGVDRVSGKTYTILQSAAITATGTTVLKIGPGLTAAANLVANDLLPPVFRIVAAHGDADSATYSIAGQLCA